jgi:hypothetical protein
MTSFPRTRESNVFVCRFITPLGPRVPAPAKAGGGDECGLGYAAPAFGFHTCPIDIRSSFLRPP